MKKQKECSNMNCNRKPTYSVTIQVCDIHEKNFPNEKEAKIKIVYEK